MRLVNTVALLTLFAVLILTGLLVDTSPIPEPVAPDAQQTHEDIVNKIIWNSGLE